MLTLTSRWTLEEKFLLWHKLIFLFIADQLCVCRLQLCNRPAETNLDMLNKQTEAEAALPSSLHPSLPSVLPPPSPSVW